MKTVLSTFCRITTSVLFRLFTFKILTKYILVTLLPRIYEITYIDLAAVNQSIEYVTTGEGFVVIFLLRKVTP